MKVQKSEKKNEQKKDTSQKNKRKWSSNIFKKLLKLTLNKRDGK